MRLWSSSEAKNRLMVWTNKWDDKKQSHGVNDWMRQQAGDKEKETWDCVKSQVCKHGAKGLQRSNIQYTYSESSEGTYPFLCENSWRWSIVPFQRFLAISTHEFTTNSALVNRSWSCRPVPSQTSALIFCFSLLLSCFPHFSARRLCDSSNGTGNEELMIQNKRRRQTAKEKRKT